MSLWWIVFLPVMVFANKARGGGCQWINNLPGRQLWWSCLIVGVSVSSAYGFLGGHNTPAGIVTALGFLAWGTMGWGLWYDLHRLDVSYENDPRWKDPWVKAIWAISFKSDYLALFWRHFLFILPYMAFCYWFLDKESFWFFAMSVNFAIAIVISYEIGWHTRLTTGLGEYLTGAVWWFLIYYIWGFQ